MFNKMIERFLILYYYFLNKFRPKFKTREELENWQDKKVQKFIRKIIKKSPFYKKYYAGLDIKDWKNFPLIDKKIMMENFDELNTKNILKQKAFEVALKAERQRDFTPMIDGITVGLSSGTSGNRGLFLASKKERCLWAGTILNKILPENIFKKCKIAFFLRANSNLYETIKGGSISFCFFDLLHPLDKNIEKLNNFNPDIIIAPPSLLKMLAKNYKNLNVNPKKIISVAEVLDEIDRKLIEKTFNQKIHEVYQATEGSIASTCRYGTLHINEDVLVVQKEYIDKKEGKFIPVITDFKRTTQPCLRYRLNDILTERKTPCPCGSIHLAIEKIEGRQDDVFYFKKLDDSGFVPIFPDFISRAIIYASDKINDYKVIQVSYDEVQIFIDNLEFKDKVIENFLELVKKMNCKAPKIVFIEEYDKNPVKKFKRIENAIEQSQKNI